MRRAAIGLTSVASVAAMAEQKTIVIGGGVTGVCTAYYLARKGRPCTLIDPVGIAPAGPMVSSSFHLPKRLTKKLFGYRLYSNCPQTAPRAMSRNARTRRKRGANDGRRQ